MTSVKVVCLVLQSAVTCFLNDRVRYIASQYTPPSPRDATLPDAGNDSQNELIVDQASSGREGATPLTLVKKGNSATDAREVREGPSESPVDWYRLGEQDMDFSHLPFAPEPGLSAETPSGTKGKPRENAKKMKKTRGGGPATQRPPAALRAATPTTTEKPPKALVKATVDVDTRASITKHIAKNPPTGDKFKQTRTTQTNAAPARPVAYAVRHTR
ncbi:hypothetical protein HDU91_000725, partial [Kappamyces sp. JEL0680]